MSRAIGPAGALIAALAAAALTAWGASRAAQVSPANPGSTEAAIAKMSPGYLPRTALPDSLALLPPPPATGSAAMQRDEEARQSVAPLRGGPRWNRAASDADLAFPHAAGIFSCAAGIEISREGTPHLYGLLERMLIDVGLSTYSAKNHYNRTRPFVAHSEATCLPRDEAMLRNDGSYPSGHSAAGWGWALVLAELVPDRADEILQRGRDFGQSRLVCGAHWQSDIDAGRMIASAAVARLHADPGFKSALESAREEITAAREAYAPPAARCTAESASLATG